MNEPMVSHDAVAFYLLSQEVAKHVKVVQSGQGADEVFAGYHWYPPMTAVGDADIDGGGGDLSQGVLRPYARRRRRAAAATVLVDSDVSGGEFVREHFARPYADSAIDRALRLDSQVMLVDDPVKRVDSMTMAWGGLEARVPFLDHELVELAFAAPAHLKTAQDGKGVLKDIGRQVIPAEVIDRPKGGYFPVPALKHLQGPYLDMVRDALTSRAAGTGGSTGPRRWIGCSPTRTAT